MTATDYGLNVLHERVTTALDEAADALNQGYSALMAEDAPWNATPQQTHQTIQQELAALTHLIGAINLARRSRRPDLTLKERLIDATHQHANSEERTERFRQERDELIRQAITDGTSVMHIHDTTGLSRERIYQIRDRRR